MTRHIVFVTQELDPVIPGGAGAVIAGLASSLSSRHQVSVLLGAPNAAASAATEYTVVPVALDPTDGTLGWFVERSRRLAMALAEVCREQPVDLVEFCDFEAVGFFALAHRDELGLTGVRLAVRLHGPIEAVTAAIGVSSPLFDGLGRLERQALAMADAVLVPSAAIGEWAATRYRLDPARLVVAEPPVPAVTPVRWTPSAEPSFAVYGRLAEQKGVHDLARALPAVLDANPVARIGFIGADGWSVAANRPMSAVLLDLIPARLRDRVELIGPMDRQRAMERMASAWAVVFPSRFETFCLAAHEVRRAGLPVIVSALAAFAPYRGFGMLGYDGTVAGLEATLLAVAADRGIAQRLAAEPIPVVGDPTVAYDGDLPAPRHPRSQAGLATIAVQEEEAVRRVAPQRGATTAARLLRLLPAPVARLARRLVPRAFKERFRRLASWPVEVERRQREERRAELRSRVRRGEFPPLEAPRVSVVIPCFQQGQWVEDAVASVFAQRFDSWEIVLVDDGSTDPATIAALDELGTWPRVRLVRQSNRGLPAARNAGIAAGSGEFIVPLDADDELEPGYLEVMVAALEAHPDAAYAHCWARLFGDVDAIWVPRPFNRYWQRLSNGIVGCVLLRRSAWEAVGGYDETMRRGHEDWELWLRLDAAGWDQVRVNQPLFRYRKRGVSMSVASEAGFEAGRQEIRERHPRLYGVEALRAVKQVCYPLLAVIVDRASQPADAAPPDVAVVESPWGATGKYVADGRGRGFSFVQAVATADRLEAAPGVAAAVTSDAIVVWRRWVLADTGAEVTGILDGEEPPPGALAPGAVADPDWIVDVTQVPEGLRVMRQRPEEAGRLPDWVVA